MIKLVILVVAALLVFMVITQPETAGDHGGEIIAALGVWAKDIIEASLQLIKDVLSIFTEAKKGKG